MNNQSNREVYCEDALLWLKTHSAQGDGPIITSLPDAHELNLSIELWRDWFVHAAQLCIEFVPPEMPVIFYQTDRRADGVTYSKFNLCYEAAEKCNAQLVFHKIVLRHKVGAIDLYRPGYSHLIAFSRKARIGKITADVIPDGKKLWPYGMGMNATRVAVEFAKRYSNVVYDPFCGQGTVLAVANQLGLRAVGVELDSGRAQLSRDVVIESQELLPAFEVQDALTN